MATTRPDHYAALGVAPSASEAEIRAAFKKLARSLHPDKQRQHANPQDELFATVCEAYETLSDPVKRASYDLERGNGDIQHVLELQKKDAERASQLMAVSFDQRRKAELNCGGLIVDDAWYGASEAVVEPEKHASQVINVTRQLQCLVDGSKLVIAKGDAKSHLTGVYDPCPGNAEKALRVDYFFKGKLHQALVRDDEMLLAPVKAHLVPSKASRGSASNAKPSKGSAASSSSAKNPSSSPSAGSVRLSLVIAVFGLVSVVAARGMLLVVK